MKLTGLRSSINGIRKSHLIFRSSSCSSCFQDDQTFIQDVQSVAQPSLCYCEL